ncbi:MAG: uroporphyrinogen decarboxylase family protein [Acetobacteraceae bacterium]|nr:uroporphyrinogen decarboxylase family protein [Acetobacteraceae bacterium]
MLHVVAQDMARYLRAVREAGADGVFFSINGAITAGRRAVDRDTFETLMRPFDLELLEAAAPMVRILHVHGAPVEVSRVLDYPVEVLSVSDRLPGNPTLAQLRALTALPLMGGIDESLICERSVAALRAEIADAVRQNGGVRGLIIAPGCTIPTQTPSFLLRAMVETTRGLALAAA